jgi:hypothetical protein
MTVGNQPAVSTINNALTMTALALRGVCQDIVNLNMTVANMGTAGLEALGFDSADAASVVSQAAVLGTVAAVYYGSATQATEYDFNNALCGLWAGQ